MGLFKLLGEVVTLPIRVVEMPVRALEKATDSAGESGPVSEMLRDVRRAVVEAGEETDED
jgi:hypothetical protein